jgi:segregation and condensation protein B
MATRKTREELDAEMGQSPAETGEEEPVELIEPVELAEPAEQAERAERAEPVEAPAVQWEAPQSVRLTGLLESLLLAAEEPIELKILLEVVSDLQPELTLEQLKEAIEKLRIDLREQGRGIRIGDVAGGYQLRTPTEAAPYIKKMVARRPPRLTRATLETLAIVAYRQPVTRGEVEEIRGVDCGAVLKHLLDKKLVKILGRKDDPGRPLLYGTTKEFLAFFSMKDLKSLPTLQDFAELDEEHRAALGLGPRKAGTEDAESRLTREDFLDVEETDAYAPVGEDEVMTELSETLSDLKQKNRELQKTLPQQKTEKDGESPQDQPQDGQKPPDSRPVMEEPGGEPGGDGGGSQPGGEEPGGDGGGSEGAGQASGEGSGG